MEDEGTLRRNQTFSQAEGLASMPAQLALRELSPQLRAKIWKAIYVGMMSGRDVAGNYWVIAGDWREILLDHYVDVEHKMVDTFSRNFETATNKVKKIIVDGKYNEVFDFLEFVLKHPNCSYDFRQEISDALEATRSAYRLVDDEIIVPIASDEEVSAVKGAFDALHKTQFNGARVHLKNAAGLLTRGDYSGSIRESIHAVDGVARALAPGSRDLRPALDALRAKGHIHSALRNGFTSLYGYTSDEKGIRHALIEDGQAKVTETDALFMMGSCASFITYLIGKAKEYDVALQEDVSASSPAAV